MNSPAALSSSSGSTPPTVLARTRARSLLDLAAEVRLKVYGHLLSSEQPIELKHHHYLHHANDEVYGSILRVCKTTYQEAHVFLYATNRFNYDITQLGRAAIKASVFYYMGSDAKTQLRNLTVQVKCLSDLLPTRSDKHQICIWKELTALPNLETLTLDMVTDSKSAVAHAISRLLTSMVSSPQPDVTVEIGLVQYPLIHGYVPRANFLKRFNEAYAMAGMMTIKCPQTRRLEIKAELSQHQLDSMVGEADRVGGWHLVPVGAVQGRFNWVKK